MNMLFYFLRILKSIIGSSRAPESGESLFLPESETSDLFAIANKAAEETSQVGRAKRSLFLEELQTAMKFLQIEKTLIYHNLSGIHLHLRALIIFCCPHPFFVGDIELPKI